MIELAEHFWEQSYFPELRDVVGFLKMTAGLFRALNDIFVLPKTKETRFPVLPNCEVTNFADENVSFSFGNHIRIFEATSSLSGNGYSVEDVRFVPSAYYSIELQGYKRIIDKELRDNK